MDVSVIIPTYNRLWSLPRAIESCRNTRCNTEIIVVDDGSTDGTWDWLQQQKDVLSITQMNQGQTWAINRGFSKSTGRFIRFLDSDDFLCEGTIDLQYNKAVETNADLVYGRVDLFNQKTGKKVTYDDPPLWDDFLAVQLGEGYGSHFLGMLFKRQLIEQVPRRPDFAFREDRMFLLEIGMLEPKIDQVPGCMGYWVQHPSQMHDNYRGMKYVVTNFQHLNIYRRILGELEAQGKLSDQRKKAAAGVLWKLAHWTAFSHPEEAHNIAEWVWQLNPQFKIPENGPVGWLYRQLGFQGTEKILKYRRAILNMFRVLGCDVSSPPQRGK